MECCCFKKREQVGPAPNPAPRPNPAPIDPEKEYSDLMKEIINLQKSFSHINSQLYALKTPSDLGYFVDVDNRNKTNEIDRNREAFYQLKKRFNDANREFMNLRTKEWFRFA